MTTTEAIRLLLGQLAQPLLDPASRTWWPALVITGVVAGLYALIRRPGWSLAGIWAALRHPSSVLDLQLLLGRRLLWTLRGPASLGGAWLLATRAVRWLDAGLGRPEPLDWPLWAVALAYSLALFLTWDASRFLLHALMHRVPALWALHQVHHSAEVLTPLTFHRIHPLESLLYELRGVLVTGLVTAGFFYLFRGATSSWTLLGVPASGLLLNVVFGNLRHSHVWLRFPPALERWFLSPAQHQIHHSADRAQQGHNLGTWLAVWDRAWGTLELAERPPERFGLTRRNHGDDLISAWLGPLRSLLPSAAGALLLLAPGLAQAQDEELEDVPTQDEAGAADEEVGMTIIVTDEDGTPRVAGSAHVLGEEELERFEYDNIEQVLGGVPGVTTRSEDGYGLRPNIGIRGANSDRSAKVTLMEDGVLLAPAPYAAPAAYYFPMSTRMVGVEVFKGPASTRHGPNTVGGAINLRTRSIEEGLDWRVDLAGGLRQTGKLHAYAGYGGDKAGVLAEGVLLHTAGFKQLDGGGDTGFDHGEAMLKGYWKPAAGHRLELKGGYAREVGNETYLGLSSGDLEATPYRRYAASALGLMDFHRSQAELAWSARPSKTFQARTVAYHHYLTRSWTKLNRFADGPDLHELLQSDPSGGQGAVFLAILRGEEDSQSPDQQLMIGTNLRRFHSAGVQSTVAWSLPGEAVSSRLELGLRLHQDLVWRLHSEDAHEMRSGELVDAGDEVVVTRDSQAVAQALALHAHEELRIGQVHLLPGARLEVVRTELIDASEGSSGVVTRAAVLPGAGALWTPTGALDVFAGVHRGFSPVAPGQPEEVRPELSWNSEAGLRWGSGQRQLEMVGFFTNYQNITGQCTMSGGCGNELVDRQFNGGQAWVYGGEASARYTVLLPIELTIPVSATYAYTRSSFRNAFDSDFPQFGSVQVGDSLPYVPEHQGQVRLTLAHPRAELSLGATGRSAMLDEAGAFPASELDVPALVLVDAGGSVHLGERWSIYATGTNLTNRQSVTSWRPAGARPTAPLQVMLGVKAGSD